MFKYIISIMIILMMGLIVACSNQPAEIEASLGQQFDLEFGQTVKITGEPLQIKFAELVGDSRCPSNVVCIWQGEASCLLEITYDGVVNQKTITQPGLSPEFTTTEFNQYEIQFNVQPYPVEGKQINDKDYYLRLIVDKKPELSSGILASFDVVGESYKIFITNKETIDQVFAVQNGESKATIPSGRLLKGTEYNQPWSWHIDPEDIHMAELTIELCDGTPSQVEENLDYWINTVQRFCPWSAKIVNIEDFR